MAGKIIVKPTVNFLNTESDADLLTTVRTVVQAMTGNPDYPSPFPTLASISAAADAFTTALAEAADGGKYFTAVKNARRTELVSLVRQLASYVGVACGGEMAKLLSSGFPTHKPVREAIGIPAKPATPKLRRGAHSGELTASTRARTGADIFNWRLALASAPEVILQRAQTTGGKQAFSGLTPGQVYQVRVNAVGSAGASDWSGAASLMVV